MNKENKLEIYEKYSEILDGIFYYQDQQIDLRTMCSKIMLGTFALVGGLLFAKIEISSSQLLILNVIFPFLSLIVVTAQLFTDLIYKERLKIAFVSEAVRLEKTYNWLPKFHLYLMKNNKTKLAADGQIIFYFGNVALLLLLSSISALLLPEFKSIFSKCAIILIYLIAYISYHTVFSKLVKKTKQILSMIENE